MYKAKFLEIEASLFLNIEKGLEIVQVVRKDGAAGLWEYLKDQFADLKTKVMDAIMDITPATQSLLTLSNVQPKQILLNLSRF